MKVLICGSRSWGTTADEVFKVYDRVGDLPKTATILVGGAKGADTLAADAALKHGNSIQTFIPDWGAHGRRAGIVRNLQMLDQLPDLVIAFWDGKSRGTKHTISEARKRSITVEIIRAEVLA